MRTHPGGVWRQLASAPTGGRGAAAADERRVAYGRALAEALGPDRYRKLLKLHKEALSVAIGVERGRGLG